MNRRDFLTTAGACVGVMISTSHGWCAESARFGVVTGHAQAAQVGKAILAEGGNAVDAAVGAALVAGVVALPSCGIGGYGGHLLIGQPSGCVIAIDFNGTAPAAAREDLYPLDDRGEVTDRINVHGWLAAGVPGTLAGLQLALDRYGTWPFARVVGPAIKLARDGFAITDGVAKAIKGSASGLQRDVGSAALLVPNGEPLAAGTTFRNPDLAALLQTLADRNSVESFYRGDIARRSANEFQRHGGLVTEADLNGFRAREVSPLVLDWNGSRIITAPLTAGGLTVLQALAALKALGWEAWDRDDPRATHARVESLRVAWHDRLSLLGDPDATPVPVARLLSAAYADESAKRIRRAVDEKSIISGSSDGRSAGGTIHISAADACGTLVALTLTHGEAFGAQVTVEGLGLTLGHGMSRFNPRPDHPNSVRPGRRPLHNMCPTLVCHDGRPVIALGATGGRRIPNSLFDVLLNLVSHHQPLAAAVAAPRLHTEGGTDLDITKGWPEPHVEHLRRVGYTVAVGPVANLNGVSLDPQTRVSNAVP
jgi:gamma-glutamyltranspeptidase/glutathione hydrolase